MIAQPTDPTAPGYIVTIAFLVVVKLPSTKQLNNTIPLPTHVNIPCQTTVMIIILIVENFVEILRHQSTVRLHQLNVKPVVCKTFD